MHMFKILALVIIPFTELKFTSHQQSCVMNSDSTTPYLKLEQSARQGNPISTYLLIIVLDIIFAMSKSDQIIKRS